MHGYIFLIFSDKNKIALHQHVHAVLCGVGCFVMHYGSVRHPSVREESKVMQHFDLHVTVVLVLRL